MRKGKTRSTRGKAAGRKEKGKQRPALRFQRHWGLCCPHPTSEWHALSKEALSGEETPAEAGQKQDQSMVKSQAHGGWDSPPEREESQTSGKGPKHMMSNRA